MNPSLVILAALAAAPVSAGELQFFDAEGIETVEVRSQRGPIDVAAGAPEIRIEVLGEAGADDCRIEISRKGSRLFIQAKSPTRWFWQDDSCKAGFRVTGPSRLALKAEAGAGDVRASGWSGSAEIDAGVGRIELSDMGGDLTATTGVGEVVLSWSKPVEGALVRVRLGVGDARLRWAKAPARGKVEISTGLGDAEVSLPKDSRVDSDLQTGLGSSTVEVARAPESGFKIALNSGLGDVAIRTR